MDDLPAQLRGYIDGVAAPVELADVVARGGMSDAVVEDFLQESARALYAQFDQEAEPQPESVERSLPEIDRIVDPPGAARDHPDNGVDATTGHDGPRPERAYLIDQRHHGRLTPARLRPRRRRIIGTLAAAAVVIAIMVGVVVTRPDAHHRQPVAPAPSPTTVAQPQLYWSNSAAISHANLNGTGLVHRPLPLAPNQHPAACGVAADDNYVYWPTEGGVSRVKRDGTGLDTSFIAVPEGGGACVAVDGTHVYWATALGWIGRANLDGTDINPNLIFIEGTAAISSPCGMAVDSTHIYWGDPGIGAIGRANLDGTGINYSFIPTPEGPAGGPCGIAVDSAHIYWGDASVGAIGRANLDGTGVNQDFISMPTSLSVPPGVGAGPCADDGTYLYYISPTNSIGRAQLDGTHVENDFISGAKIGPSAFPVPGNVVGCAIGR